MISLDKCHQANFLVKMKMMACGENGTNDGNYVPSNEPIQKVPLDMFITSNPMDVVKARKNKGRKKLIQDPCRKDFREKACKELDRLFYHVTIPFYAAIFDSYANVSESIGQSGPGLSTFHVIVESSFLRKEVEVNR